MKASEMTNEELASEIEEAAKLYGECNDDCEREEYAILCEAAARLRKRGCKNCEISKSEMRFRYERDAFEKKCREDYIAQGKVMAEMARQNVALRAKLKVADDALVVCRDGMCGECHRQHPGETCVCPNGCYEMSMAKNALAAIREEGGAK